MADGEAGGGFPAGIGWYDRQTDGDGNGGQRDQCDAVWGHSEYAASAFIPDEWYYGGTESGTFFFWGRGEACCRPAVYEGSAACFADRRDCGRSGRSKGAAAGNREPDERDRGRKRCGSEWRPGRPTGSYRAGSGGGKSIAAACRWGRYGACQGWGKDDGTGAVKTAGWAGTSSGKPAERIYRTVEESAV